MIKALLLLLLLLFSLHRPKILILISSSYKPGCPVESKAFSVATSTAALDVILLKFKELFTASNHISKDSHSCMSNASLGYYTETL
jgi:hypothetical protein